MKDLMIEVSTSFQITVICLMLAGIFFLSYKSSEPKKWK